MLPNKLVILFLLLAAGYCKGAAQTNPYQDNLQRLHSLSLNNLNVGNKHINDSIISLCLELEPQARAKGDNFNLFLIGQTLVNASCQKGDIGTAIAKTKQMYEEAEKKHTVEGLILSLQAFGSSYLHSGQYKEAHAAFAEAEKESQESKNELLLLRLAMQQFYTCLALHSVEETAFYLDKIKASPLLQQDSLLALQILYYEAAFSLIKRDLPQTAHYFQTISAKYGYRPELGMLHQMILSQYCIATGDYTRACTLIDSLLHISGRSGSMGYRNTLWLKARILSLSEQYDQSCSLYETVRRLSDSINVSRYTSSVDTLRAAHHTNQLKLENITAHNRFMIQSIILIFLLLVVAIVLFLRLRRKNRQIRESKAELSRVAEAATQSIHTKSLFLSNMSHDLRTPLNAIVGFSNLLADKEEIDDETKAMCGDYIKQNSELLLKLFNDILDLSALNESKMHFEFAPCNITVLCKNTTDSVIRSLKNSDNTLLFESHTDNLMIITDNGRLQQVLINLMVNATKFTQGGTIRLVLKVDEENQEAIFTVEDTGCGIPLDKQPGIFERFEKLNEKKQGAGLGLSICKLIVDRLGGRIWIDPEYTQGARFVFTHPLNIKQESC